MNTEPPACKRKKLAVVAAGNPLAGDDGWSFLVLEGLKTSSVVLPDEAELIELGTAGMELLHILLDFENVIILDTAFFGGRPGEVAVFSPAEVKSRKILRKHSLHEGDILHFIEIAKAVGDLPENIIIVAVQASTEQSISFGQMSQAVRAAVNIGVEKVRKTIEMIVKG